MSNYLITLSPLGKFFFGGDMTFQVGEEEKSKFNQAYASYIIESCKFPQQTSLLGMMRYLLLTKCPDAFDLAKRRIKDHNLATSLIGASSFSVKESHNTLNNYGEIKSLGPCVLMDRSKQPNEVYLPSPKDFGLHVKFNNLSRTTYYNGERRVVPNIDNYDPKTPQETVYIGTQSGSTQKEDELFTKDVRIGINKNYKGKSDTKGFYKQISYRLKKDFCFAFAIETDFDLSNCQNELVSLGADGSKFALSASLSDKFEISYPVLPLSNIGETCSRIVLLSDTLLEEEDLRLSCFSISELVGFRYLKTTVHTENYNITKGQVERSQKKYDLYKKGSVFYFDNPKQATEFKERIKSKKEFNQIGYNYYTEINIKNE